MTIPKILSELRRRGSRKNVEGMARYGIVSTKVFGVSLKHLTALKKKIGRNHPLALKLWKSGWLEARILAAFIADPEQVTPKLMNMWAKDFDNWAITDGVCLHLFADTPHGPRMALQWIKRKHEFVKRAGFVIIAVRAVHDKKEPDSTFRSYLPRIVNAAGDDRNGVKKAVNWALRQIGKRNLVLHKEASQAAEELARSSIPSARWIGKDAIRELKNAKTIARTMRRG